MAVKSSIEKLADTIGFEIGVSDNITQAKLINSFCKGLHNSILHEKDLEMQIIHIVNELDSNAEKILIDISEFIKLKNKNHE